MKAQLLNIDFSPRTIFIKKIKGSNLILEKGGTYETLPPISPSRFLADSPLPWP